ncbi:MAG: secretin N-terminal domain-containing protein [Halanaerobiaceae bacterium]
MFKKIIINLLLILFILCFTVINISASKKIEDLHFQNTDIQEVLRMIGETAETNLVIDSEVSGEITIHLRDVSFSRSLDLITQSQGLSYIWDQDSVVVASQERIDYMYSQIATEIIEIKYGDLDQLKNIIKTVNSELIIDIYEENNQLIIKGKPEYIDEIKNIISKIDIPVDKNEINLKKNTDKKIKIISLNSTNLDDFLHNIQIFFPEIKAGKNKIKNEIILFGKEKYINEADNFIKKLDISSPIKIKKETSIIDIKNKNHEHIEKITQEIYKNLIIRIDEKLNRLIISGDEKQVNRAEKLINKLNEKKDIKKITRFIKVDYIEVEMVEAVLEQLYVDKIEYETDKNRKRLLLRGEKESIDKAVKIIKNIDEPLPQVKIEAKIEEISRSELKEIGINPSQLNKINFIKDSDENLQKDISLTELFKIMEEKGKAKTLANPKLMTLNGKKGKLLIGDKVPVEFKNGDEEEKIIEYLEAGIILEFQPWITEDDNIELEITPKINSIGEYRNGLPTINTREITTTIRLENMQTFIIGGLIRENIIEDIKKIPVISELPVLGKIFKYQETDRKQTEIIIVITPEIVR